MKKIISLLLIAALMTSVFLSACNSDRSTSNASSSGGSSDDKVKVCLILSQRDEWLSYMEVAASAAAKEMGGVEFNVSDAQSDTNKMLQFVQTAKTGGYDAVIVNMVDPNTAAEVIESAGDMKVVFVNRYPSDPSVLNENAVYVGSDENTSGRFQGEFLADYFNSKGQTEISYILLNGILGQTSTTLRSESVLKALADNGITAKEATSPLACKYDRAEAMDKISPLLSTVNFDCIISNNDAMALGVIEAMEGKNIDPSETPIVGIDATADGRQAVKEGKMAMSVFQNPTGQGAGSLHAAVNLVQGNPLNEGTDFEIDETGYVLWVPFEPVTIDNVAEYDGR